MPKLAVDSLLLEEKNKFLFIGFSHSVVATVSSTTLLSFPTECTSDDDDEEDEELDDEGELSRTTGALLTFEQETEWLVLVAALGSKLWDLLASL